MSAGNWIRTIACLVVFLSLPGQGMAADARTTLARQGFDRVINLDFEGAGKSFAALESAHPDYPLTEFLKATIPWAQAEAAHGSERKKFRRETIRLMEAAAERADKKTADDIKDNELWRLAHGMAVFFAGRMHADDGRSFKAYGMIRGARDELRGLVADYPGLYDAYLVLGMYEYIAGSVPASMKWLAALMDLKGELTLGVEYLELASSRASILAPEAARMLLFATGVFPESTRNCAYLPMARFTREKYTQNPHFSVALQLLYVNCGYLDKALEENGIAERQFTERFPKIAKQLKSVRVSVYRDQGKVDVIRSMKEELKSDPVYWKLILAQALDVDGKRSEALKLYNDIYWADIRGEELPTRSGPSADWILDKVERYRKKPYSPASPEAPIVGDHLYLEGQPSG